MAKKVTAKKIARYCKYQVNGWFKVAKRGEAKNWTNEEKMEVIGRMNAYIDIICLIKALMKGYTLEQFANNSELKSILAGEVIQIREKNNGDTEEKDE